MSKLELGRIPEGPSDAALARLAAALDVPEGQLAALKEQDAAARNLGRGAPGSGGPEGDAPLPSAVAPYPPLKSFEQRFLRRLRGAPPELQDLLAGVADLGAAAFRGEKGDDALPHLLALPSIADPPEAYLRVPLARLADALSDLGDCLAEQERREDALRAFSGCERLYRRAGHGPGLAAALFRQGRVYARYRAEDGLSGPDEYRAYLRRARGLFDEADRAFAEAAARARAVPAGERRAEDPAAGDGAEDRYREREPENLACLADVLLREWAADRPGDAAGDAHVRAEILSVMNRADHAFVAWVRTLEQRPDGGGAGSLGALADAHQRHGFLQRLRLKAAAEGLIIPPGGDCAASPGRAAAEALAAGRRAYRAAVELRLRAVRHSAGEPRLRQMSSLSNGHQEWAVLLHEAGAHAAAVGDDGPARHLYAGALYQYRVARHWLELVKAGCRERGRGVFDLWQESYLEDQVASLERDLGNLPAAERAVRAVLEGAPPDLDAGYEAELPPAALRGIS